MQMLHSKLQEAETTIESTRSRLLQARLEASNPDAEHADDYYEQDAYGYDDEYDEYDDFEEQLAPEIDQSKLEITEGPIKKRARGRFTTKRWADRYMRVTRAHLEYFDDAEKSMSRGTIYLDEDAEVFPGDSKGVHKNRDVVHTFTIALAGKEPLVIAVDTEEEMEQWVQTIQYIIDQHKEHTDPERREERRRQRRASSRRGMPGGGGMRGMRDPLSSVAALEAHKQEQAAAEAHNKDLAMRHRAWGPGISEAVLGEEATFTIQPDDAALAEAAQEAGAARQDAQYGGSEYDGLQPQQQASDSLLDAFKVTLANEDLEIELHPEDVGDGTLQVTYAPPKSGTFELSVKYKDQHIFGSPFLPEVSAAPTAPKHCLVTGDGAQVARLHTKNTFTVVTRDQFDNPRETGGDQFEILVHGPAIPYDIIDHGNGCYTVTYEVQLGKEDVENAKRGVAPQIEIEVNMHSEGFFYARPIAGSPFLPRVQFSKEDIDGAAAAVGADTGAPSAFSQPPSSTQQGTAAGGPADYMSALSPDMQAALSRAQALTRALAGGGGEAAPSSTHSVPMDPHSSYSQSMASVPAMPTSSAMASPQFSMPQSAAQVYSPPTTTNAQAPMPPPPVADEQLMRERAELEAAKADFASQMQELQRMRAEIAADRELVASQMDKVTQLGKQVQEDAHALTSRSQELHSSPQRSEAQQHAGHGHPSSPPGSGGQVPTLTSPPLRRSEGSGVSSSPAPQQQHQSSSPAAAAPGGAPAELFQPEVMALFDNFTKPLIKLFKFYADKGSGRTAGLTVSAYLRMCKDYLIVPTFTSKTEVKGIFADTAKTHNLMPQHGKASTKDKDTALTFAAFTEAIGRQALVCLSRPAMQNLYPTPRDKVLVVLEMWGLGDTRRLQQVKSTYQAQGAAAAE